MDDQGPVGPTRLQIDPVLAMGYAASYVDVIGRCVLGKESSWTGLQPLPTAPPKAGSAAPPWWEEGPALDDEPEPPILSWAGVWLLVVCTPLVVLGIWWNGLFALAQAVAARSW